MNANSLDRRLKDLEHKQGEPVKYVLRWADEENSEPSDLGVERIRLKWADDLEKQH